MYTQQEDPDSREEILVLIIGLNTFFVKRILLHVHRSLPTRVRFLHSWVRFIIRRFSSVWKPDIRFPHEWVTNESCQVTYMTDSHLMSSQDVTHQMRICHICDLTWLIRDSFMWKPEIRFPYRWESTDDESVSSLASLIRFLLLIPPTNGEDICSFSGDSVASLVFVILICSWISRHEHWQQEKGTLTSRAFEKR